MANRILLTAAILASTAGAAHAQTAYQINRANQALQICASPMGASIPECAQLNGLVGNPASAAVAASNAAAANMFSGNYGGVPAVPGVNNGTAGALFGMAAQAFAASRQAAPAAPAPAAGGQDYPAAPAPAAGGQDYYVASANAAQNAAMAYQACIARAGPANPAGVQGCIAQLQAVSTPGAAAGFPQAAAASGAAPLAAAAAGAFSALMGR